VYKLHINIGKKEKDPTEVVQKNKKKKIGVKKNDQENIKTL